MVEIRTHNLTRRFGDVTAVDRVSVTVPRGELFFLLGPSGCGKTTLLRLIAGFLEPDQGTIHFDDRRIDSVPASRRNTGMVFQNYALWPHMNVERNVRYGLDVRRVSAAEKRRRVDEILRLVRMTGYEKRLPAELSGGQQQRVAVARALVIEPDVVLLDEPLSNLDAKLRLEMRAEIRRIHRNSPRTMIYVTHDQKEALSMADRVALMRDGRVVQVGTPEEVYVSPGSLFAAQFIGNCNMLSGTVRRLADGKVVVETPAGTLSGRAGDARLREGVPAVLTVRPELLHPARADESNAFTARVLSRMYLGEMVQYQVESNGVELTATVLETVAGGWAEGETVTLAFDEDLAIAFAPEPTGAT